MVTNSKTKEKAEAEAFFILPLCGCQVCLPMLLPEKTSTASSRRSSTLGWADPLIWLHSCNKKIFRKYFWLNSWEILKKLQMRSLSDNYKKFLYLVKFADQRTSKISGFAKPQFWCHEFFMNFRFIYICANSVDPNHLEALEPKILS